MQGRIPLKYLFQAEKCSCQHGVKAEQGWEGFKFQNMCSWGYIFLHASASHAQLVSHPGKEKLFPAVPGLMASTDNVGLQRSSLLVESLLSASLLLRQHVSDQAFGSSSIFNTTMLTACCF